MHRPGSGSGDSASGDGDLDTVDELDLSHEEIAGLQGSDARFGARGGPGGGLDPTAWEPTPGMADEPGARGGPGGGLDPTA